MIAKIAGEMKGASRMMIILMAILMAVALITAVSLGFPVSKASASATGSTGFGPYMAYKGVNMYLYTYSAFVSGSGLNVQTVSGRPFVNWPGGVISNWYITAEFFDMQGRWYATYTSATRWGSWYYMWPPQFSNITINKTMKTGMMYSTLYVSGARATSCGFQIK